MNTSEKISAGIMAAELDRMTVPQIVEIMHLWCKDAAEFHYLGCRLSYSHTVRDIMQAALALADRRPA